MDKTVNAFLKLYKHTEVGEVAYLCSVLAANRILNLDSLPWILTQLLDAKAHLALLAVEGQDYCLYLVANLQEILS